MRESEIQRKFLKRCNELKIYAFKIIASSKRGVADVCVIHRGKVYFVEFKRKGQSQTELQKNFEIICKFNNVEYLVVNDVDKFNWCIFLNEGRNYSFNKITINYGRIIEAHGFSQLQSEKHRCEHPRHVFLRKDRKFKYNINEMFSVKWEIEDSPNLFISHPLPRIICKHCCEHELKQK